MNLLARAEDVEDDTEARKVNEDLEDILLKISQECAKENEKAMENISNFLTDPGEGFNQARVWNIKRKLIPKTGQEPPTAKKDKNGNLRNK